MKIEILLLGLFASFLMVGCSQNDDAPNASEEAKGKDSYVSVNIISRTDASRAAEFEYGQGVENKVNSAYFFFFKADGTPYQLVQGDASYKVEGSDATISGTAIHNWLYFSNFNVAGTQSTGTPVGSVEKILSAVLVFDGVDSEMPDKMTVVLNAPSTLMSSYQAGVRLSTFVDKVLLDEATAISTTGGGNFVMSNSVYQGDGEILQATSIAGKALESAELAIANPVNVYVERLAAKVSVKALDATDLISGQELNSAGDALKVKGVTVNSGNVYAKILYWDLNTTINQSYLLKHLSANATYTGFNALNPWNDATNHRSYWAETPASGVTYDKTFAWHDIKNNLKTGVDYCLENTSGTSTKIVVAAQLVNESGDPLTVAQWMAEYYVPTAGGSGNPTWDGPSSLLAAVANSLGLFYYDSGTWTKIKPNQLQIVPLYGTISNPSQNPKDYYKVKFALNSNISTPLTWRAAETAEAAVAASDLADDAAVNAIIGKVAPAKVWQKGAAYYFTALEHVNGEDAVVRNHHYVVSISGVNGLGTPVYYPDSYTPENPTIPQIPEPVIPDDEIYLSAKINVLSWRLVNNNVVLGQ